MVNGLPRNAAALVDGPRVPKFEIQPFTMDEARKFLAAAKGDRLEAPYGPGAAAPVPFAPTFIGREYALRLNSLSRRVVELTPWRTGIAKLSLIGAPCCQVVCQIVVIRMHQSKAPGNVRVQNWLRSGDSTPYLAVNRSLRPVQK